MKFFCIADVDTVRGFRLAGVDGIATDDPDEASRALAAATANPDIAIVLLGHRVAKHLRRSVDALCLASPRPLFVEVPSPSDPETASPSARLIQNALGFQIDPHPAPE